MRISAGKGLKTIVILCSILLVARVYDEFAHGNTNIQASRSPPINLVAIACGDRGPETMTMLKSTTIFTQSRLFFRLFVDDNLRVFLNEKLLSWPSHVLERVQFQFYPISYPRHNQSTWDSRGKLCSQQRVFMPELLPDVSLAMFTDTDVVFLRPLEDYVNHFKQFNSIQLLASAPDGEGQYSVYYNKRRGFPYYGKTGLNTAITLMNLSRMRQVKFVDKMAEYHEKYKTRITLGDQDTYNIYFHYNPEQVYELDCSWNFFTDHCKIRGRCMVAEKTGSSVVHGIRGVFRNDQAPVFKVAYNVMERYNFEEDLDAHLYVPMQMELEATELTSTKCGNSSWVFTKMLRTQIDRMTPK